MNVHKTHSSHSPKGVIGFESLLAGTILVGLVVCGSLIPYKFDFASLYRSNLNILSQLTWTPSSASDAITNFLIYIPVGITAYGWLRRIINRYGNALFLAGTIGVLLSLALESLQVVVPGRCASWVDVILNGAGSFIGAFVAPLAFFLAHRLGTHIRTGLKNNPAGTLLFILITIVMIHGLAPFDFATSADAFKESILSSQWRPFMIRENMAGQVIPFDLRTTLRSSAATIGLFLLLGSISFAARREQGDNDKKAIQHTVITGMLIVILVEVLQLFVRSHVFDTADILINGLSLLASSLVMMFVFRMNRETRTASILPVSLLIATLGIQIAWPILYGLLPMNALSASNGLSRFTWVPFSVHFHKPFAIALSMLMSSVLQYGLLSATAIFVISSTGRLRWTPVIMIVLGTVTLGEIVQSFNASHVPDVTEIILALLVLTYVWRITTRLDVQKSIPVKVPVQ